MLRMLTREAFERRTAGGARTPVYREFLADRETPVSVLSRVADGKEDVFLLESVYNGDRKGRYSYLGLGGGVANPSAPFAAADELPSFQGGRVGYFSYEAVSDFEPRVPRRHEEGTPSEAFMEVDAFAVFDSVRSTVTIAKVDERRKPIEGTEQTFDCDTVLLSVGLIPENELTRAAGIPLDSRTSGACVYEDTETGVPGIFACGNVLHVHDLVDYVTAESQRSGRAAAAFARNGEQPAGEVLEMANGSGVTYTVPQRIRRDHVDKAVDVFFRVNGIYRNKTITVRSKDRLLCAFPREHLAPGEMEHIVISKKLLADAHEKLEIALENGREA